MKSSTPSLRPLPNNRPLPPGVVADDMPMHKISASAQTRVNDLKSSSNMSPVTQTSSLTGEGWVRQDMPSHCVCYKEADVYLRPLTVATLKSITAATADKNFTSILDALASHVSIDIRELTVPDFYFILYWLRLNSYPRSPLTVTWTSKYGNKNVSRITMSSFDITELAMTKVELEQHRKNGLDIPRIADMEMLSNSDLSPADKWEMEHAQYVFVENMTDYSQKLDKLNDMGPDGLSEIKEFSTRIAHGVLEQIKATDSHFQLDAAISYVQAEMKQLATIVAKLAESDESHVVSATAGLFGHMETREMLLDKLKAAKANNTEIHAEEEVVTLGTIDVSILFP